MFRISKSVVPSVFTVMNQMSGYLSILATINGKFSMAAYFIIIATLFDALDGKIARKLNQPSHFGLEFDSMADIISFGLAPSVLLYKAFSGDWVVAGAIIAFVPLLFAGIRLAKFNIHSEKHSAKFVGLPVPGMAMLHSSLVLFNFAVPYNMGAARFVIPLIILTSTLMISHIPFDKFPHFSLKRDGKVNIMLWTMVASGILMLTFRGLVIFPITFTYLTYVIGRWILNNGKEESEIADSTIRE